MPGQGQNIFNYSVIPINLNVAGSRVITGPWSVARFVEAVDAAGNFAAVARLTIKAERDDDAIPFLPGFGVLATATKRFILEWEAQTGLTARVLFSSDPRALDVDADPPVQLLTGTLIIGANTVLNSTADNAVATASAEVVAAANGSRALAIIQNLHASASVRIGDASVSATRGIELGPGDVIEIATTEAIHVRNDSGASVDIAVVELES